MTISCYVAAFQTYSLFPSKLIAYIAGLVVVSASLSAGSTYYYTVARKKWKTCT